MVGKTFTYLLGSDAAALMFNSKNEDLNAEDVYARLTTPVFGKGVAYDVPNPVRSHTSAGDVTENFTFGLQSVEVTLDVFLTPHSLHSVLI